MFVWHVSPGNIRRKELLFLKNSVLVLERYLVAARLFFLPHAFFISLLTFHWLEKHGWRFLICSLCGCSVKIRTSCVRPSLMNAKRLTVSVFHHPRKSTEGIHPENFKDGCPITNVRHDAGGWRYPTHLSGMPAMGRSSRHMSS